MRIAFLSSGGGSSAKFLHKIITNKTLLPSTNEWEISILADRECGALEWAKQEKINNRLIKVDTGNEWEDLYHNELQSTEVIITTIFKIIPKEILDNRNNKFINLHYSILPAFSGYIGEKTILKSIEYGSKFFGATAHYVSEHLDLGKPITQAVFAPSKYKERFIIENSFKCGCMCLINALLINSKPSKNQYHSKEIVLNNQQFIISPCVEEAGSVLSSEVLWRLI